MPQRALSRERSTRVAAWAVAVAFSSTFGGCDGCSERAEVTPPSAPSEPVAEEARPPEAPAPTVAHERPPPLTAEERAHVIEGRRARRIGRRHLHAGRFEEAVASFRAADAALDTPSTRCELGWALLQANEPEEARAQLEDGASRLTGRAHLRDDERRTLGACLYNLGRLVEPTAPSRAAGLYRRSLEVRPDNAVVQARLDALGASPSETAECAPRACLGPAADLDALRALVLADLIEAARGRLREQGSADTAEGEPDRTRWESTATPIEFGDGLAAVLLRAVDTVSTRYRRLEHDSAYVGVRTREGWWGCFVATAVHDMSVSNPVAFQWVPGGLPELTVDVDQNAHGWEEGVSNTMGEVERVFIGFEGARPMIYGSVYLGSYYDDAMWSNCDYGDEDEGEGGDDGEPGEDDEHSCQDDPSICCELEDISTRDMLQIVPGSRPGWIRREPESEEGADEEPAPPSSAELELAHLPCSPPPS